MNSNGRLSLRILLSIMVAAFLSSCAEMTHLTRIKDVPSSKNESSMVLVDAKQRAIIGTRGTKKEIEIDASNLFELTHLKENQAKCESLSNAEKKAECFEKLTNTFSSVDLNSVLEAKAVESAFFKFCAEPSPDALSALAASQGFSFSKPNYAEVAQTLSVSEGASSIGLRTQSITLMRDAMYRYCEAFLSGAVGKPAFETLHRRLQSSMVAILAIEQLTGTIRPPSVTLSGEVVMDSAELIAKYTEKTEEARAAVISAEADLKKASEAETAKKKEVEDEAKKETEKQAEIDKSKKADPNADTTKLEGEKAEIVKSKEAKEKELAELTKTKEASDENLKARKDAFESYNKARIAANSNTGSPGVKVVLEGTPTSSTAQIEKVAEEVNEIVKGTLEMDFRNEACVTYISNAKWNVSPKENSVARACNDYLKSMVTRANIKNDIVQKRVAGVMEKDEAMKLLEALPEHDLGGQLDLFK